MDGNILFQPLAGNRWHIPVDILSFIAMAVEPSSNEPIVPDASAPDEPIAPESNEAGDTNASKEATDANDGWVEPRRIFPIARIRKIMKCDADVRLISTDVPVLFARACELFITDLVQDSWRESNRTNLAKVDICSAIQKVDKFDFLIDIVPRDDGSKTKNLAR